MPEIKHESETSLKVMGFISGGCLGFLLGPLLCMLLLETWFHLRGYFFFQDMYWLVIASMPAGAALGAISLPAILLRRARNNVRKTERQRVGETEKQGNRETGI